MVGPERRLSFPLKKHPLRECNIWPVIQREKAQASAKYHFSNNEHSITAISCVQQKMVVNKKFGPTFEKNSGNCDPTVNILHYRKPRVRRVPKGLPCAISQAHGEEPICRA